METEWGEGVVDEFEYGFVTTQMRDRGGRSCGCQHGCDSTTHLRLSRSPSNSTPALSQDTLGSPTFGPAYTKRAACWKLGSAMQGA